MIARYASPREALYWRRIEVRRLLERLHQIPIGVRPAQPRECDVRAELRYLEHSLDALDHAEERHP